MSEDSDTDDVEVTELDIRVRGRGIESGLCHAKECPGPRGVLGEKVGSLDVAVASHVRCSVACCRSARRRATSAAGEGPVGTEAVAKDGGACWEAVRDCGGVGKRVFWEGDGRESRGDA